ncbi:unnamed protein product [Didymodactylos carnosus]|uniref:SUEL-type lectin domain-containing protein n=1 Tax=Didymodactylos carnosus TaxID=1234261 RepID=A0A815C5F5_9BILA|nr:unnamed protein product [Didymodactylos carnosus]CAF4072863.1 unnamed protein product [Didymodactylos carnosus]
MLLTFAIFLFFLFQQIFCLTYESCCSSDDIYFTNKTISTTTLSCSKNYILKLRSVNYYYGNGCSRSNCKRRSTKYYLMCNNLKTCKISIKCVYMDNYLCPELKLLPNTRAEHIIVDYDCISTELESPLIAFNRFIKEQNLTTNYYKPIRSPFLDELNNTSTTTTIPTINNQQIDIYNEKVWNDYILKNYLTKQRSTILIDKQQQQQQQHRSLVTDVLLIVIILIVFAFVLIICMLIGLLLYKKILLLNNKKKCLLLKHQYQSFSPGENMYDNLNGTMKVDMNGTTTDV